MLAAAYIGGRIGISEATEARVAVELARQGVTPVERMMVSPDPIDPRDWGFVAQSRGEYRFGRYRWPGGRCEIREERLEVAKDSPEWRAARRDPSVRGFMTWVRFPAYEIERSGNETRVYIIDARRLNRRRQGFGSVVVVLRNGNPAS